MSDSEIKICKNCQWYWWDVKPLCLHPFTAKTDLVSGDKISPSCESMRKTHLWGITERDSVCGESGRFYAPKNSG